MADVKVPGKPTLWLILAIVSIVLFIVGIILIFTKYKTVGYILTVLFLILTIVFLVVYFNKRGKYKKYLSTTVKPAPATAASVKTTTTTVATPAPAPVPVAQPIYTPAVVPMSNYTIPISGTAPIMLDASGNIM